MSPYSPTAHLARADDDLVRVAPLLERAPDPAALFARSETDAAGWEALRLSEGTGRPLGNEDFIAGLERLLGRKLARRAPGRKPDTPPPDQGALF